MREAVSVFLKNHIADDRLLLGGLVTMAGFLLLDRPIPKLVIALVFMGLVFLSNKRVRIVPTLVITISIIAMHLLTPYGNLLYSLGPLDMTTGALNTGVLKASTLLGLIYLSRLTVRPTVSLPGTFGILLGRTLYYVDLLIERWPSVEGSSLFTKIDNLLLSMEDEAFPLNEDARSGGSGLNHTSNQSKTLHRNHDSFRHNAADPHPANNRKGSSTTNPVNNRTGSSTTLTGTFCLVLLILPVWVLFFLTV